MKTKNWLYKWDMKVFFSDTNPKWKALRWNQRIDFENRVATYWTRFLARLAWYGKLDPGGVNESK
jgi:hypothetical protein